VPIVTHPQTGMKFHVGGRIRPKPFSPKLRLANYLRASLPDPPATCDYASKARASTKLVYLNDRLGDCVVAGAAHMVGCWTGNASGTPITFSDHRIETAYHNLSEGRYPGEDAGCDEEFALNYLCHNGFMPTDEHPHKIVCWVAVEADNVKEVKTALWLFEALMSGVELPNAWINPPPQGSGFTFDVAGEPVPENGHCMSHFSYDDKGLGTATWGLYGTTAWDGVTKYMTSDANGALYAVVSQDALIAATQKAPNGFAAAELVADAHALGYVHA